MPQRARRQAGAIRRMAGAGEAPPIALLPIAALLERSATDVLALPDDFWARPSFSSKTAAADDPYPA